MKTLSLHFIALALLCGSASTLHAQAAAPAPAPAAAAPTSAAQPEGARSKSVV